MHNSACLICEKALIYTLESKEMDCIYCGKTYQNNVSCEEGHYVCDDCHRAQGLYIIKDICTKSISLNPYEIAIEIMEHSTIHMHGPEHHVIVSAALLTAYKNAGGNINWPEAFNMVEERSKEVPGGICGFWGACGAAIGAGIFLSIATSSTPLSKTEWGLCNRLTSECLKSIGEIGGPRCCKRNTSLAIQTTIGFIEANLSIKLQHTDVKCNFYQQNKECIGRRCPYR